MPFATHTNERLSQRRDWQALLLWLAMCLLLPLLAACGGSGGGAAPEAPPPSASALIGPAGGTLTGPDGAQLVVPPGALSAPTTFTITRRADGAPPLGGYLRGAGAAYEITPHNQSFAVPVLVRLPVPAGVDGTRWLVASPGEDWTEHNASLSGGMAELLRNRLSWYYGGWGCATSPNDTNPSGCTTQIGGTTASTVPAQALQLVNYPDAQRGSAGNYRLEVAANVSFTTTYRTWANCGAANIKVFRRQLDRSPHVLETLFDQSATAATQGGTAPGRYDAGSVAFPAIPLTHALNGQHVYSFRFSCTRPDGYRATYGDDLRIHVAIPVPTSTQTVGGSVSGLMGSLTLHNNGGDALVLNADGPFTFPTPVGTGSPYQVTVASQPAGQTCTVQNGGGSAATDVSNVAVDCITHGSQLWRGATLVEQLDPGAAHSPRVAFDGQGNAFAVWAQSDGTRDNIWANRHTPGGGWGTPQIIDSSNDAAQSPKVVADSAGNAVALWEELSGGLWQLRAARYSAGAGWSAIAAPESEAGASHAADLGIDGAGNAMAVWVLDANGQRRIRANRLMAGAWQTPAFVDGNVGDAGTPRIAVFASGVALAVWQQAQGGHVHLFHNAFNGTGWSTADQLNDNTGPTLGEPSLAHDGNNGALLVWTQDLGSGDRVLAARYAGGLWQLQDPISNPDAQRTADARIAMNGNGEAMAVWRESHNNRFELWSRPYRPDGGWNNIPHLVRIDAPLASVDAEGEPLSVAMDPLGNAQVVFAHRAPAAASETLHAVRYDAINQTWLPPQAINNGQGSVNTAALAVDANGRALAVWDQDQTGNARLDIWSNLWR